MKAVIVGGGIIGASVALELARSGVDVTIVERTAIGAEASSAAAGMLAPQLEASGPGPFLDLMLRSRAMYASWVAQVQALSGLDVAYLPSGVLQVAFDDAQLHALEATVAWQRASGLRASLLTSEETRHREPALSGQIVGAAHLPDDHQVDPAALMRSLAKALSESGVMLLIGTVREIVRTQGRATGVQVDDGRVLSADVVVLAAGAWSSTVKDGLRPEAQIGPVRGQILSLTTPSPVVSHIVKGPSGYLVPRGGGRVIVGSTMEHVGYDTSTTGEARKALLGAAHAMAPALTSATVESHWAGLRPGSKSPMIGESGTTGLLLATGHFRNGVLLAPVTAKLIGQLVRGEPPAVDLAPFRISQRTP
ncbi:MAG: glycine oxidase ThiO [Archangium sp.]|nr:glycine oxidase ThiO [Archangium sp.]